MQFGIDINNYKTAKKYKKVEGVREDILKLALVFIAALLVSRVMLKFNTGVSMGIAPFGLAFLLAITCERDFKKNLAAFTGVAVGYATVSSVVEDGYANLIAVALIVIYNLILEKVDKKLRVIYLYGFISISYFIYGHFICNYDIALNIIMALVKTAIIVPVYYVIGYAIKCIDEFNTNYFYSVEEILSIGMLICLLVSGIGDINIVGISIRNIVAYCIVLLIAYIGGSTYGAAIGVSMGIIVGISSGDMISNVAFYSVCGLVSGIFKDTGKMFSFLSLFVIYFTMSIYLRQLDIAPLIEVLLGGAIFFLVPTSFIKVLEEELKSDSKKAIVNNNELNELKSEFTDRVQELQTALLTVSKTLRDMGDNNNLTFKNKSTALIENLADRVCKKCGKCDSCWGRDFNGTYASFETIIKTTEEKKVAFPNELEKMCLYKFELLKNAEKLIVDSNKKEKVKEKLSEGRVLLAGHVENISLSISDMLGEFSKKVVICDDIDRLVRKGLNKNSIPYKRVFCYRDVSGRLKVKLILDSCGGASNYCSKSVVPVLSKVLNMKISIGGDGCSINPNTKECTIIFEEAPKYYLKTYAAMACKDGEQYSGDSYSFGKTKDGSYITMISDGMGSGPEASRESKATVELVDKFLQVGFSKDTAINMVNSIMSMKFEEDEKFTTLDMNKVDLYSGEIDFIKVGAVASFMKRGKKVREIVSSMPPFGLVDNLEVQAVKSNIRSGDLIVTISDGVVDVNRSRLENYNWLQEYLVDSTKDPKELSFDILERAKALSSGRVRDDMTVVVSKVLSMY